MNGANSCLRIFSRAGLPRTAPQCPSIARWRPAQYAVRCKSASSDAAQLRRTPLYDLHLAHGAKMVPFAGYSMPLQYQDLSVGDSHRWTREKASLFDVGHMVQHRLSGPAASLFLKRVTPSSIVTLKPHHSTLSCLLHPGTGGIVDDTVITRLGPEFFYLVTNAACREKDTAYLSEHIKEQAGGQLKWEVLDGWGLVAIQGPLSAEVLAPLLVGDDKETDLSTLYFGQSRLVSVRLSTGNYTASPVLISRGGYTGEDGFEISLPPDTTSAFTEALLQKAGPDKLRLAGLGARDSLRLEAGMCLYGHDLDDTTTPVEGSLSWIIGKHRRVEGGFFGDTVILAQLKSIKDGGPSLTRRRVGLIVEGAPAREGAEILSTSSPDSSESAAEEVIGKVTSGCPSPSLPGTNIAMGYVKTGFHRLGTRVDVMVRSKKRKATVAKMPFIPTKYWKAAAPT